QLAPTAPEPLVAKDAAVAPAPLAVISDPTTGLDTETFSVNPTNTPHTIGAEKYWSGPDGVQVTHFRPIQPKQLVPLTGTSAHGGLITELTSSDVNCVDPVYARPIVDLTANERELSFGDVAFPSKVQTVRTFETPTGRVQQLVLVTGQFFTQPCATNQDPQVGVQRLFSHVAGHVFRSTSADYIPPAFQSINATRVSGNAAFAVDVTDQTPTGAGQVKEVVVGVRSGSQSAWTFADLVQSAANIQRWTGAVPIGDPDFEYFVQAVDAAGNVGVSTNKGFYFAASTAPPPVGNVDVAPTTTPPPSGWFDGSADVQVTVGGHAPEPGTTTVSVDGGPEQPYIHPVHVTGDGLHTVRALSTAGSDSTLFLIDSGPPTVTIATPAAGAVFTQNQPVTASFVCADAGIGVQSCTVTGPAFSTSVLGTHQFSVTGTDRLGKSRTVTVSYEVKASVTGKIVFSRSNRIWVINPDGTGLSQLTGLAGRDPGTNFDDQPAKSPDGRKVVFARRSTASGARQLWVIDADGRNPVAITSGPGDNTDPAWSPDGSKIAFGSTRPGSQGIDVWVATWNPSTLSGYVNLTNTIGDDVTPSWSPTSAGKIAFASNRNKSQFEIFTMTTAGGSVTRLTNDPRTDIQPGWSPDGTKIVFSSDRTSGSGAFEIFVMGTPDGNTQTRLTTLTGDDTAPYWLDSSRIVFASAQLRGLAIVAPTGGASAKISNTAAGDANPG
ncbi:MAG TPA: hypothetical protein VF232_00495, partial [Gaiellaceae bacterium]